jgi:hypothetical protein
VANINYFTTLWYTDFLGIGYILDNNGWSVFPIFSNLMNAQKLWTEHIEPLDEKSLKMRFIEYNGDYKFILYPFPFTKGKTNFGFYRSLESSKNYSVFKQKFNGEVLFRFGMLGKDSEPIYYPKSKLVTDVKFMKNSEVVENSIEWIAEEVQRRMRAKYG